MLVEGALSEKGRGVAGVGWLLEVKIEFCSKKIKWLRGLEIL